MTGKDFKAWANKVPDDAVIEYRKLDYHNEWVILYATHIRAVFAPPEPTVTKVEKGVDPL